MYVFTNEDQAPKPTGLYISLEFRPSYSYCILPSDEPDRGRLMSYQSKPDFLNFFKNCFEFSKVNKTAINILVVYSPNCSGGMKLKAQVI